MKKNIILLLTLLCQVLGAAAEDKVYISDFSIKAGETKRIEFCFDTQATDITRLEGTVTMPAGLTVQNQASSGYTWMTGNDERTGGALVSYNPQTGGVKMTAGLFTPGTGAVGYIDVMASTDLAESSTITVTGFQVKKSDGTYADVASENCTVTLATGEGGGGEGGEQGDELTFAFSPESLTMTSGQTATVDVTMTNGMTLTGMQATLTASNGITVTGVTKGGRMAGTFKFNAETGNLTSLGSISGNEGTVFTVTLQAGSDFSGSATLTVSGLKVTTAGAQSISAADITLPVTVQSQKNVALAFDSYEVSLAPDESVTVDVTLSSEVDLTGFKGTLTLPDGITATVANGALLAGDLSYNETTGNIVYLGGMTGREGVLFTLTLTADDSFTADGTLSFTDISTTTSGALSIVPADIEMDVLLSGPATGISTFAPDTSKTDGWYGLNGCQLAGKPTPQGIYIQNGKKVLVRDKR